ncbi:diacylglycerol kinase family protein [Marinifilum sp.]|uniref:diacylglycerol kinase family protein n=1 Tax=Marinifilum sp. TaxID=2033137 RepID=UPI003BABEB0B
MQIYHKDNFLWIEFYGELTLFNTAIENICDFIHPDYHDKIKKIKDISAAAVLIGAITALLVGLLIFLPKLTNL